MNRNRIKFQMEGQIAASKLAAKYELPIKKVKKVTKKKK